LGARRTTAARLALAALAVGLALGSVSRAARALPRGDEASTLAAGDGYRISVLTMGPGDDFVTFFGHDALLVERRGLPSLVYNFGMYTQAAIAPHHVLGGTLLYFLHVDYLERTLAIYRAERRTVTQQVLALDTATARRLAEALSVNSLPANTTYHYDFALDNCTTRVRDALDRALGGALRTQISGRAALTYREHALRFTASHPGYYLLFDLGLGRSVDRPLAAWDDAYLPDRLAADLGRVQVTDASGTHPLVTREATLFDAGRPPVRERPPVRLPLHLLVGAAVGALLFVLGRARRPAPRVGFGLLCALVGAVVGALGLFVLLLLGTDVHVASHDNYNALVCPAWALGLVPGGLAVAFGRRSRLLAVAAGQAALLSGAGLVLAAAYGQDSWRIAALVLPPLSGAWLGARAAARRA
jgi:hypothetical protein